MNQDDLKRAAALAALDHVEPGEIVGVGTGSTANHFIDGLARMDRPPRGAVASSLASARRLTAHGIPVVDLADAGVLPVYVDGADEATRERHLVKGGGGALTREKIVAQSSRKFVCICDASKLVDRLGVFPLPVEVIPMATRAVADTIQRLGGRPVLRADYATDNGNEILDVHDLVIDDPVGLETELNQIPGVVTNGLFCRRPADLLLVADRDGVRQI